MKKVILGLICFSYLSTAEVITAVLYTAKIAYDKDSQKSLGEQAQIQGIHLSVGTLNYLLEMEYSKMNMSYKSKAYEKFTQDDISLAYSLYFKYFMFKVGGHYINNNDPILGNGYSTFATIGGYVSQRKSTYYYGIEGYYSKYKKGHDEAFISKPITIIQLSPYFKFEQKINQNWQNQMKFQMNYQMTDDYLQKNYISYTLSNTLSYNELALVLKSSVGEMKTGVKDGGFTIVNTLDTLKTSYGAKVGYHFLPEATVSLSYNISNYQEYGFIEEAQSSLSMVSLNGCNLKNTNQEKLSKKA